MTLKILQSNGTDTIEGGTYSLNDGTIIEYAVGIQINGKREQYDHYLVVESPSGLKAVVLDGVGRMNFPNLASLWAAQAIAAREISIYGGITLNEHLYTVEELSDDILPGMDTRKLRRRLELIADRAKRREPPLKKLVDKDAQALVDLVIEAARVTHTATTLASLRLDHSFQRRSYHQGDSQSYFRNSTGLEFSPMHNRYQHYKDTGRLDGIEPHLHNRLKCALTAALGRDKNGVNCINRRQKETLSSFGPKEVHAVATDGALACGEERFDEIASDWSLSCEEAVEKILEESAEHTRDNQTLFLARVLGSN